MPLTFVTELKRNYKVVRWQCQAISGPSFCIRGIHMIRRIPGTAFSEAWSWCRCVRMNKVINVWWRGFVCRLTNTFLLLQVRSRRSPRLQDRGGDPVVTLWCYLTIFMGNIAMSVCIDRPGELWCRKYNIMGALGWVPAYKTKFWIRNAFFFSHSMPFITAHGFIGLKFIRHGFQNSSMDVSEA